LSKLFHIFEWLFCVGESIPLVDDLLCDPSVKTFLGDNPKRVQEIPFDGSHRNGRPIKEIIIVVNFKELSFPLVETL
jgi:hypothetical protein